MRRIPGGDGEVVEGECLRHESPGRQLMLPQPAAYTYQTLQFLPFESNRPSRKPVFSLQKGQHVALLLLHAS